VNSVALIYQPIKAETETGGVTTLEERVAQVCARAKWAPPLCLQTTPEDPGQGVTAQALDKGVDLVLAAGGDGTIRAVASALAGCDVPLAILPIGTGNLLVRNLGLPNDLDAALGALASTSDRSLDLGYLRADDPDRGEHFVVMAGMGFDAAMMEDAPERLKEHLGWAAYVVSGARHLTDRGFQVEISIDDGPSLRRRARGVLVGNVGRLQGGLQLLPDAVPDDGFLDVAVLGPRHLRDWALLAWQVIRRRQDRAGHRLETFRGRRVSVRTEQPQHRQLDGDVIDPATHLEAEVRPGALRLRVPASEPQNTSVTSEGAR
jgi:YegS/Rv2252/BmrU family lipid kinase